jgi:hypothetical protein
MPEFHQGRLAERARWLLGVPAAAIVAVLLWTESSVLRWVERHGLFEIFAGAATIAFLAVVVLWDRARFAVQDWLMRRSASACLRAGRWPPR